jgi:hypothetical protein
MQFRSISVERLREASNHTWRLSQRDEALTHSSDVTHTAVFSCGKSPNGEGQAEEHGR